MNSLRNNKIDFISLILRIGAGAMMLTHGYPKLLKLLSDEPIAFANVLGMGAEWSLFLAVFAEVFCSILLLIGFRTRIASVPLFITMFIAVFMIHAGDPFSKQEMGLHYMILYLVLMITGSGKFSTDYILSSGKSVRVSRLKSEHNL